MYVKPHFVTSVLPTVVAVIIKLLAVLANFKDLLFISPVDAKLTPELLLVLYKPYTSPMISSSITIADSEILSCAKVLIDNMLIA